MNTTTVSHDVGRFLWACLLLLLAFGLMGNWLGLADAVTYVARAVLTPISQWAGHWAASHLMPQS